MGVCNCSMFCCTLLYVPSSFAIILIGKRELVSLLSLSSWCRVIVVWLFLAVPWVRLQFVSLVFPDHTHLLFKTIQGRNQTRKVLLWRIKPCYQLTHKGIAQQYVFATTTNINYVEKSTDLGQLASEKPDDIDVHFQFNL